MRLKEYLKEGTGKVLIERTAILRGQPVWLMWELFPNKPGNESEYYKMIEDISFKEAITLKRRKIITFDEAYDFNTYVVSGSHKFGESYKTELQLRDYEFDPKVLGKELKKLKFRFK